MGRLIAWFVSFAIGVSVGAWLIGGNGPQPPVRIDLGGPGRYVALGDSYSAGEGLAPFRGGTQDIDDGGDRCHRSDSAYAVHLVFVYPTSRVFRACAGAIVPNVFDKIQEHDGVPNHQGLQVEQGIAGDDVKLVTLTMGGNDVDFAKVLRFCFFNDDCANRMYEEDMTLRDWVTVHLRQLKTDLAALYQQLRQSFPKARILVLGYPALFPLKAPRIYKSPTEPCFLLFTSWTLPERVAIREWGSSLNRIIQEATQLARSDIEYVDIASHFAGHEACGAGGEWVQFVGVMRSLDSWFHPTPEGQAMMARIASCHLDVFPEAHTPRTKTTEYAMYGCVAKGAIEVTEGTEPSASTANPATTPT